jgi:hypothetical protein
LPSVLWRHWDLIVTLEQVNTGKKLAAVQIVGQVKDTGQGVAVVGGGQIEASVVAAGTQ